VLSIALCSRGAFAHNYTVHRDMTDLAYEIMLIASQDSVKSEHDRLISFRPQGVDSAEWESFLQDVSHATHRLRGMKDGLGASKQASCSQKLDGAKPADQNWAKNQVLSDVQFPVALDHMTGNDCGVLYNYCVQGAFSKNKCVGGIYAENNAPPPNGHIDFTGEILGFWAADIDDHTWDTHLFIKPTSIAGIGDLEAEADDLATKGLEIPLIPLFCLVECIFGDCGDCDKDAHDFADSVNPTDEILGMLPGCDAFDFCDIHGLDYVGVWHFIGLQTGANNDFDDHSGYQMDNGGPFGAPDPFVTGVIWFTDNLGFTLNYSKSDGPKQYQIGSGQDFHRDTKMRSRSKWMFPTFPHLIFEPVDNLGKYGWDQFQPSLAEASREPDHGVKALSWPLHALGDATVPMHVVNTSGWGHRPFEDSIEDAWPRLIYLTEDSSEAAQARSQQIEQAKRILRKAYTWRKSILDWRTAHPGNNNNLPVRDLITAVAQETFNYAQSQTPTGWPYNPYLSLEYAAQEHASAPGKAALNYEDDASVDKARPLIENGSAAILAFLMSAAER
jgi:hypothetical protein